MTLRALVFAALLYSLPAQAAEFNPDALPDPLNKVYFGARVYPESGPVNSMQIEVSTVQECIDHIIKAIAHAVGTAKAIEVRCVKERNADKPS